MASAQQAQQNIEMTIDELGNAKIAVSYTHLTLPTKA